jgi:hypothetical protein
MLYKRTKRRRDGEMKMTKGQRDAGTENGRRVDSHYGKF